MNVTTGRSALSVLQAVPWRRRPPIAPVPGALGALPLPEEYRAVMTWTDGGVGILGPNRQLSLVELWTQGELETQQELVRRYMQGGLSVGGDQSGWYYVYDLRGGRAGRVVVVDGGDLGWDGRGRVLGRTLGEAFEAVRDAPADADDWRAVGAPMGDR